MDYFNIAFGGFEPQKDQDAAVKFALNCLVNDEMLEALESLLAPESQVGGIAGEPGWMIERRDTDSNDTSNIKWPTNSAFRVFVDPDVFELAAPEFYMDRQSFKKYVKAVINAYIMRNLGSKVGIANKIKDIV